MRVIFTSETSCRCGDVNDDGVVNIADVCWLVDYLYVPEHIPPDPMETGDANNDCVVDVGDLNYLYLGGTPPECCWIHQGVNIN